MTHYIVSHLEDGNVTLYWSAWGNCLCVHAPPRGGGRSKVALSSATPAVRSDRPRGHFRGVSAWWASNLHPWVSHLTLKDIKSLDGSERNGRWAAQKAPEITISFLCDESAVFALVRGIHWIKLTGPNYLFNCINKWTVRTPCAPREKEQNIDKNESNVCLSLTSEKISEVKTKKCQDETNPVTVRKNK